MWIPTREFERLQREIDRAFEQTGLTPFGSGRTGFLPGRAARQYPLVNIYDDGTNLSIEALAPGVEPDKLDVTVTGNSVTLAGEKPGLKDVPPEKIHRGERASGRFIRMVELPVKVDADKAKALYRDGIVLLTLPRSQDALPRRISVQNS